MQCCTDVRATYRKHQTPQLRMEGTGEGCGCLCSPKLPYLSTISQQFVADCRRIKITEMTRSTGLNGTTGMTRMIRIT